jgi:hypothetical protein
MHQRLKTTFEFVERSQINYGLKIVGTGEDPGFSSKSAPTSPNYWPFQLHLRSRCSLTRSSYGGVAGQRCLQPREYQVDPTLEQYNMHISLISLDLFHTSYQIYHSNAITVYQMTRTEHQSHITQNIRGSPSL